MKRLDFFKVLGIAITVPSILVSSADGKQVQVVTKKFNPKRWPIYPETVEFTYIDGYGDCNYSFFTYVKIEYYGVEFLVPVKQVGIGNANMTKQRFEWMIKDIKERYIVDEWMVDKGFIIKYDKNIHH